MKPLFFAIALASASTLTWARDFTIEDLTQSCREGNLKRTEEIVGTGVKVTGKDQNGWFPLSIAAAHGQSEVVQYLLKKGADVNERTSKRNTPLIFAASRGHHAVVELLLNDGADRKLANRDGETASSAAKAGGFPKIAEQIDGFRGK